MSATKKKGAKQAPSFELAVVTGLAQGSKLSEGRRVTYTPTGAHFNEHMTYEQWVEYGRGLKQVKATWDFINADWMSFGKRKFGEEKTNEAIDQLEFEMADVERASKIALLNESSRRAGMSAEHHFIAITMTKDEEKARQWLITAQEEKLSAMELKRSIEAGKVVRDPKPDPGMGGFLSLQGISMKFELWRKRIEKTKPLEELGLEDRKVLLNELQPFVDQYERIKNTLAIAA